MTRLVTLVTISTSSSLAEAKSHLSELVARVKTEHQRITVTVHGRPAAVLLAVDDLEAMEETIAVLSDSEALRALADAEAELVRGEGEDLDTLDAAMKGPSSYPVSGFRYELEIAPSARKQLSEQPSEGVAFAAYALIRGALLDNPHRVGKRLRPPLDDRHSARRGTYRVLYRIDDDARRVTVLGIYRRSDAYRI